MRRILTVILCSLLLAACGIKTMPWMNGTYKGEVSDDKPDGYGVWTGKDQQRYAGFWVAGKQNGNGTYVWKNNTYRGGFKDG